MRHVIIGTGPAGVIAAETLRKVDPASQITLIGDEPEPPYSRMALPYYLIGDIEEQGTHLRKADDYYSEKNIDVLQDKVVQVLPAKRMLKLGSGSDVSYDRLAIASGAHPVSPPVPGIDLPGVHPCWTLEDGRQIARLAVPGARVVLMGAGFIGCIILEALVKRGVDLTVVEMEDRMVPRMMNQTAGNLIKKWCLDKGVKVYTTSRIEAIDEGDGGSGLAVRLDNGQVLPADVVISATGVQPNDQFLAGSGIETALGVVVNRHLQTSVAGIYAAGDVAEGKDFSTGEYSVQAIQPTAADHGRIAALNMAGHDVLHQGSVNMNVLATLGLISTSFGLWAGVEGGDSVELTQPARYRYLNLQFQDDVLVGATSLGLTEHVGVLRGLIQSRVRLGPWKGKLLKDPTRVMEAYLASTQTLGANARVS
ncbi:MAG: FAD-dependent oxidoreductase [Gammaproteobacteria bacterium]|nr:MAG: FAD-dependent oxidoreductase [Gammaproteobacteria bacterium]